MEIVNLPLSLRNLQHELRTPITGILGMAHILKREPLSTSQREYVEYIISDINRLRALAEKLLQAKQLSEEIESPATYLSRRPE